MASGFPPVGLTAVIENIDQFENSGRIIVNTYNQINTGADGISSKSAVLQGVITGLSTAFATTLVNAAMSAAGALLDLAGNAITAVTGAMGEAIGKAMTFEQSIADIAAKMGKSIEEIGPLRDMILELSLDPNLKVTADEAAEAVRLLAQNGLDMTQIMDGAAKSTIALANATDADFGTAADIATDAMAIFNINAEDMERAIDGIVGVTTNSKLTIDDYALALAQGGAVAEATGVSFEDFNTALAAIAPTAGNGQKAGTALRTAIMQLGKPTKEMQVEMDKYGISLFDSEGKMRSLGDIAQQLHDVFNGTATVTQTVGAVTDEMRESADRARAALPSLNEQIRIQQNELALANEELALQIQYYGEGSPQVRKLQNRIDKMNLTLSNNVQKQTELQDSISDVDDARTELITTTKELTDEEKTNLATVLGGAKGSLAILGLAKTTKEEFDNLSAGVNESGQAMGAAATRVDTVKGALEILRSIIDGIKIQIGDAFLPVVRSLVELLQDVASNAGPGIIAFFQDLGEDVKSAFDKIMAAVTLFQRFGLEGGVKGIAAMLGADPDTVKTIGKVFDEIQGLIDDFFAGGLLGAISGGGVGSLLSLLGLSDSTVGLVEDIIDDIIGTFDRISEIASAFESGGIQAAILELFNVGSLEQLAGSILANIPVMLSTVINGITSFLINQAPVIQATTQEWVTAFWSWVDTAITGVGTALAGILLAIAAWAVSPEASAQLTMMGQSMGDLLVTGVQNAAQNAGQIAMVVGKIALGLLAAIPAIMTILAIVGGQIVAGIVSSILENFGINLQPTTIQGLIGVLQGIGANIAIATSLLGQNIVTGITTGITTFQASFGTFLQTFLSTVITFVTGLFQEGSLYAAVLTMVTTFLTVTQDNIMALWDIILNGIVTALTQAINTVMSVGSVISAIISMVTTLINTIANKIREFWMVIKSALVEAVTKALDIINDIKDKASKLGKNIMEGIKAGMEAAKSAVIDTLTGIIKSAINAAKAALGIDSPSKVFAGMGSNIGSGLVMGIMSSVPMIEKAMGAITAPALLTVNSPISPQSAANAARSGSTSNQDNRQTVYNFNYDITTGETLDQVVQSYETAKAMIT